MVIYINVGNSMHSIQCIAYEGVNMLKFITFLCSIVNRTFFDRRHEFALGNEAFDGSPGFIRGLSQFITLFCKKYGIEYRQRI